MDLYYEEHDVPADQRHTTSTAPTTSSSRDEDAPTLLQIASTLATLSATTAPAERARLQAHLTALLTRLSAGAAAATGTGAAGTPPTAAAFLRALPGSTVRPPDAFVCPVCTDEFERGERAARLPCAHMFHADCVLPWLRMNSTCPVCRADLPTDDPAHEERKRLARREQAAAQMRAHMFN